MINLYVRQLDNTWYGLAYVEEKIVATALNYDKETTLKSLRKSLLPHTDCQIVEEGSDFAERTVSKLKEVHLGRQEFANLTLATEYIPEPQASVLEVAACIPIGYVASYGSIAKAARTEPKTVGQIMASNPLYPIVPCHRVVGTDFSLVGYGGGRTPQALKAKLSRLNAERKGFKSEKEISINETKLTVYPVERVIAKAQKHGLSFADKRQRTLTSYGSHRVA